MGVARELNWGPSCKKSFIIIGLFFSNLVPSHGGGGGGGCCKMVRFFKRELNMHIEKKIHFFASSLDHAFYLEKHIQSGLFLLFFFPDTSLFPKSRKLCASCGL